jgi:predicted small secreted protein
MNRVAIILLVVAAALTGCEATTANQYAGIECQQLGSAVSPTTQQGCAPVWGAQSSESSSAP